MPAHLSQISPHLHVAIAQKLDVKDFVRFSFCSRSSAQISKCVTKRLIYKVPEINLSHVCQFALERPLFRLPWIIPFKLLNKAPIRIEAGIGLLSTNSVKPLCEFLQSAKSGPIRVGYVNCTLNLLEPELFDNIGKLLELLKVGSIRFLPFKAPDWLNEELKTFENYSKLINIFLKCKTTRHLTLQVPPKADSKDVFKFYELSEYLHFKSIFELYLKDKKTQKWAKRLFALMKDNYMFKRAFIAQYDDEKFVLIMVMQIAISIFKTNGKSKEEALKNLGYA